MIYPDGEKLIEYYECGYNNKESRIAYDSEGNTTSAEETECGTSVSYQQVEWFNRS